jgi:S-formylglutathione hydrolase FrmB
MRRLRLAAVVLAYFAIGAASAYAAQVVTWTTTSRYVDPAKEPFNGPPPGVPARPNALRVNVYLPDGYDGHRRFPVLYLLHGHGDAYDSWVNPQRGDLLDVAAGFPGIIVMPEGARGWYTNWWRGGARSPGWERYHLDELIPLVEHRLRILPGRRWHAITGLSMGGEGATFYAEQRPGYFGSVGSFSGSISIQRPEWPTGFDTQGENHLDVYGDPSAQSFYWTGHNPTALVSNLRYTRTFVTVGDGVPNPASANELNNHVGQVAEFDLRMHANDFVAAARAAGVDVTYQPRQGIHDWPYWRHLAAAIKWGFFAPVVEHPTQWTYKTAAQFSDAWGLRFTFSAPPQTLETFSLSGQTLSGAGAGTVRVEQNGAPGFSATLPFSRTLPPPSPSASKGQGARRTTCRTSRVRRGGRTVKRRRCARPRRISP